VSYDDVVDDCVTCKKEMWSTDDAVICSDCFRAMCTTCYQDHMKLGTLPLCAECYEVRDEIEDTFHELS
jgi:hypothetical protein